MKKISEPIVFFGSGPVAAKSLGLLSNDFQIEAVVTKPSTLTEMTSVSKMSPVYSVSTRQELDKLIEEKKFKSCLGILIDFGIIVSKKVIDYFPLGIVNSHFSLLPEWRGADPITFSILSGQNQTGISLMLLVEAMDEGPLLAQTPHGIPNGCTTPELTNALIDLSANSLKEIIPLYIDGKIIPAPQLVATIASGSTPTYSRKLTKQDGIIDWLKPADQIEREIRAYLDWPKSRTILAGIDVIITQAQSIHSDFGRPGDTEVVKEGKKLIVQCGNGHLSIEKLKPAGKKEMTISAFLAGYGHKFE